MNLPDFSFLHNIRDVIGYHYGSEDLCVLLYSIVKREKPEVVVEFGTGLGVTTAWIAAALKENGYGKIITFDNGSNFASPSEKTLGNMKKLVGDANILSDYTLFLQHIFKKAGVDQHVELHCMDIDLDSFDWLDNALKIDATRQKKIDIAFSDFNHSASSVTKIVANLLSRMNATSSIFIDSASTSIQPLLTIERISELFKKGIVPREFDRLIDDAVRLEETKNLIQNSKIDLIHLIEKKKRAQNSTTWLRIEEEGILPAQVICLH